MAKLSQIQKKFLTDNNLGLDDVAGFFKLNYDTLLSSTAKHKYINALMEFRQHQSDLMGKSICLDCNLILPTQNCESCNSDNLIILKNFKIETNNHSDTEIINELAQIINKLTEHKLNNYH